MMNSGILNASTDISGIQNVKKLTGNIKNSQKISGQLKTNTKINSNVLPGQNFNGTKNYNKLENKPQINGVTLEGNKKSFELKLQDEMDSISNFEIEDIFKL